MHDPKDNSNQNKNQKGGAKPRPKGQAGKTGKGKYLITTDPIAGVRDFPPEDMIVRNWLFDNFKEVARTFGFAEYDAPVLEYQELYTRKAGEEIVDQMYNFTDKGDQEVTLRPEMTPSLARIVLGKGKALLLPVKWFSLPQCWRYETPTKGRRREHYQWNMDIVGVAEVTAEAELLAAIVTLFKRVGLTSADTGIKVSSRKVVQSILDSLKVSKEQFAKTCVIVDKLDKLSREEVILQLAAIDISTEIANRIIDSLSVKSLDELAAVVGEDHEGVREIRELFGYAEAYGIRDWLQFDASVVRGLAYYTGIVFEGFDRTGSISRSICGGGRYDRLLSTYGGKDQPMCGFGFGDCVILEILQEKKLLPKLAPKTDDIILAFNEELRPVAIQLASRLRATGRSVDIVLQKGKKLKWAYSYADRLGADRVLLLAPDEWKEGKVRVKDLRKKEGEDQKEVDVPFEEVIRAEAGGVPGSVSTL
jgi:histidyl-tRNA synthetase